jgi:transcriptional regulator with XRE-family HTH domain
MSRVTAAALIEHLRKVHGNGQPLSDEKLAAKLPISGSTLARWKNGDTRAFDNIVEMLAQAGWINAETDAPVTSASSLDPLAKLSEGVAELLAGQRRLLAELDAPRSRTQGAPKKTSRKPR